MRNYALFEAEARGLLPSHLGRLKALWRNWRARRHVRSLADLDDRLLHDIGVTREEVDLASHLPLAINAAIELERRARIRRGSLGPVGNGPSRIRVTIGP
jgi:uncharacterized protein YjiS (DUF1127 family)